MAECEEALQPVHDASSESAAATQNTAKLAMKEKEKEALEVIKADVCQWLSQVLKEKITPDVFMEALDTGILLCKLIKIIQAAASKKPTVAIPMGAIKCNQHATKESFPARDNVSNFLSWCRGLGMEEAVIFESEGLVLHRDEKRVILCLLDVARFAEKVGIHPPQLVSMEKEIEMPERKRPHSKHDESLKKKVLRELNDCKCTPTTPPVSVKSYDCDNGKLVISGGTIRGDKVLHARLLSDRIMVRVGGGWDTLDHFLLEHDPCRIKKFVSEGSCGKVTVSSKPHQPVPHHTIHH